MRTLIGSLFALGLAASSCAEDTSIELDGAAAADAAIGRDAAIARDAAPDAAEPDALAPDASEPDAAEGDADEADTSQPDAVEADADDADAGEADADEMDAAEPCTDTDGDGRGPGCPLGEDCAPNDPAWFEALTLYLDLDGDGATAGAGVSLCTNGQVPPGYTPAQGPEDCDDTRSDVRPGLAELADCVDHDCDGSRVPFGDGRDGDLVATATNTITLASELFGPAAAGDITVFAGDTAIFAAGDLALLVAVQGAGAGSFGFYRIAATSSVALTFDAPLREDYSAGTTTWIVRVSQYQNVRIPAGTIISAAPWGRPVLAGSGVIAWAVSGTLTIEAGAELSASGACYYGGAGSAVRTQIGEQGTSHLGTPAASRNANYTGGGGGSSPSLTNACGGGGGHVTAGADGQNYPGFSAAAGFGGGTVNTSTTVLGLYCGGGGGGGGLDSDAGANSHGGDGGAGGGLIFVLAGALDLGGAIRADGANGLDGVYFGPASPGGGGGGAGGTIFVAAATVTSSFGELSALGGLGGRGSEAGAGNYRGGTGGLGRVAVDLAGAIASDPAPVLLCP